jgi:hypothetical protein
MKKNDNLDDKPQARLRCNDLLEGSVGEIMPDKSKHLHSRPDCHHSRRARHARYLFQSLFMSVRSGVEA